MNQHVKSYLFFIGFMVLTRAVVAPVAKSMNIPFVKDL